jgi:large subunit ribosomal protein L21
MYAVIEVGAKQYSVKKDEVIEVDKQIAGEGENVVLDKVLLVCDGNKVEIGKPYLKEAKVKATVLKHFKSKKIVSFKYRRRKSSHTKTGFRRQLTRLKIEEVIF